MAISRRNILLGATTAAIAPAALARATANVDVTPQSLLWDGSPGLGTRVFDGLERDPCNITVASDPQGSFGQCFRYETFDWANGKERCESRGLRNPDGSLRSDQLVLRGSHALHGLAGAVEREPEQPLDRRPSAARVRSQQPSS